MANRTYFRSVFNDNFKILTWVLILFIAITPSFIFMQSANAASLGGWNVGIAGYEAGGNVGLQAVKKVMLNGQQHTKTSKTSLSLPVSRIAKVLAGGGAAVALAEAVTALIGLGVDWVLDPANNRVVYTLNTPDDPKNPVYSYYLITRNNSITQKYGLQVNMPISVAQATSICSSISDRSNNAATYFDSAYYLELDGIYGCYTTFKDGHSGFALNFNYAQNPAYDPNAESQGEEKSIPLETVAQEVISQADAGSAVAASAVQAAAQDILNEAEKDESKARPIINPLEQNASTATTETSTATATKPNTANPDAPPDVTDIALEFPVFCGWAPVVCEAAQVVISFPATIAVYVSDFWSFVREEANSEDGEVTVYEDTNIIFDDSQRVSFSSSCPASEQFSVSFFGSSQNLEFSYEPLCDFMSMIKPFVVAGSYLIGAYIVMGLSRGSAD